MRLPKGQFIRLYDDAMSRVDLTCDEYHRHSVLRGCYVPKKGETEDVLTICKMAEHIRHIEVAVIEFFKIMKG